MKDMHNNIKAVRAISPAAAVTDNTAFVSEIIDRQFFESLEFLTLVGSVADADVTLTYLVEHGDAANLSDAAAVSDDQLLGTEAGAAQLFSDDNKCSKIGYRGDKRYVRLTITPANNSGNIFLAAIAVLGHPTLGPQTTQVV